jgi:hypothetical protein
LLTATSIVQVPNQKTGKNDSVSVADKTTRLEGARLVKDLIIGMQPKGPGQVVNVNQTNQTANIGTSETNEERMKRLRMKQQEHNLLPQQVAAVPDYIDQGEDAPDDEHDEDEDDG